MTSRSLKAPLPFLLTIVTFGCEKVDTGVEPDDPSADFSKYVAMGASVTMGFASGGVVAASQQTSWAKLLADDAGATFTLPLIEAPGCNPPIAAPLGAFRRVDNSSVLSTSAVCAANATGVVLPSQNVAVTGQTAADAVTANPAPGTVTARVIASGQTQLTAMRAQNPTFVSVEIGTNELFQAFGGQASSATPFTTFSANYQSIIISVSQSGAKALLALMPVDLAKFPSLRTGAEIAAQRTTFATQNVSVNANCDASTNMIAIPKVLAAVVTGGVRASTGLSPFDLSCADVPGAIDGVLTAADITALNALAAQMNTFITLKASENGYATFSLGALYDIAKNGVTFDVNALLTSNAPFGPNISLDGIHPSAAGQQILMTAAKAGIIAKYGSITK